MRGEAPVYSEPFLDTQLYKDASEIQNVYTAILHRMWFTENDEDEVRSLLERESLADRTYNRFVRGLFGKKCLICEYDLFTDIHHVKHKAKGGSDRIDNLVLLCPNHHKEWHYMENVFFRGVRKTSEAGDRSRKAAKTDWQIPDFVLRFQIPAILIKIQKDSM